MSSVAAVNGAETVNILFDSNEIPNHIYLVLEYAIRIWLCDHWRQCLFTLQLQNISRLISSTFIATEKRDSRNISILFVYNLDFGQKLTFSADSSLFLYNCDQVLLI